MTAFLLQENVPVISIMCNRGMRGRHWKQMSDIAGFDLTPDSGTTLRKMLKLNLDPYMEQFEGISAAATKVCTKIGLIVMKDQHPSYQECAKRLMYLCFDWHHYPCFTTQSSSS